MSENQKIYLDHNATTRSDDRVVRAMLPYFTDLFENPGSSHLAGLTVSEGVDDALWNMAELICAHPQELIITSGATEAINLALRGVSNQKRKHIITSVTEHRAVLDTCRSLEKNGYDITYLDVDSNGDIRIEDLKQSVSQKTLMVCLMMVNNETGTLNDISTIGKIAHESGALLMSDATQAVGKIEVDVKELNIDLMPFSAHKLYGPKGVGALYMSKNSKIRLDPQITGGGQQGNMRSGTLNVPGIIGLGTACTIAREEMIYDRNRINQLRDWLEKELLKIENTAVNGNPFNRVFNTSNICFKGVNAEQMIIGLQNISVSNGSACSAVTNTPSHVLKAIGLSDEDALSSIRFSLGKLTTSEEIDLTVKKVTELVQRLRI
nr:cysteine desulfurase family protein [uncultured Chryseobacterium sp.]